MRVGLLGPVAGQTLPDAYGPWGQVTGVLAEDLAVRPGDPDPPRGAFVHSHPERLRLAFAQQCRAPLVTAVHGISGPRIVSENRAGGSAFVSISDACRSPDLDQVATAYHGVDAGVLRFSPSAGPGRVSSGRIHPDEGTTTAIGIARRAGR